MNMFIRLAVILFCVFILFLIFGGQISGQQEQKIVLAIPTLLPSATPIPDLNTDKISHLIDEYRKGLNLKSFIEDQRLCDIAEDRVLETYKLGYLDDHKGFKERYHKGPYGLAENVTGPVNDDVTAFESWRNSDPHRKAMEGSWTHSCLATKGRFAVQIFSSFDRYNHNAL